MQNSPSNLSEQEQNVAILREIADNGTFAEYCIAIDPNYSMQWFHEEIASKLEDGYNRLMRGEDVRMMIFMPPRHGKSDMTTQKFCSWVLGKNPIVPIMVSSYSDELATDFGFKTRDIMNSPAYRAMFNTRLRADAKAKGKWYTDKGGSYTATGVGGAQTGKGFKIGIIDDPFKNREEADSPVVRASRKSWYQSTFSTREEGNSMIVFILTRWHEDDLAGSVLKASEEAKKAGEPYESWEVINYKALATEDDEYRTIGEPLWPEKFSLEKLLAKRAVMGTYEFSALYQQNPIDEENRKFKEGWFQYRQLEEVLKLGTFNVMTLDTRGKDDIEKGKDYIGCTVNLIDTAGKWNVICKRLKLSTTDLIDLIFTNWKKYRLHKVGIENTQFWQGMRSLFNEECERRGIYPYVEELSPHGTSKLLRIEGLVPRYERGGIYHVKENNENTCAALEEELLTFPKATNDDASDSLAYQEDTALRPVIDDEEDDTSNNVSEYWNN